MFSLPVTRKIVFLFVGFLTMISSLMLYERVNAVALTVPGEYPTIQAAIDAASPGDVIVVQSGTYNENVTLNKSITLTAEFYNPEDPTKNTTIIDGGASSLIPTIDIPSGVAPMPIIRGFVIQNGIDGIKTKSEVVVEYNYFISGGDQLDYSDNSGGINHNNVYFASIDDAIDLDNMTLPLVIENNRMMYSGDDGIEIRLQDATAPVEPITFTIRNNEIIGCYEDGIQLIDYTQTLDTNRRYIISNNLIANCLNAGIGLMPDQISNEDYSGADIIEAIRVYNNTLYGNDYGISGGDNLVSFNNIVSNSLTKGVWRVEGPAGANSVAAYTLFHNNVVDADQSELGAGNLFGQDPQFAYPPGSGPDGVWGTVDDDFSGLIPLFDSPVVDAGVSQYFANNGEAIPPTPITDFSGAAPDLGWREFDPFLPPTSTATITPTSTATPTGLGTVISQVGSSSDDAEEAIPNGSVSLGSSDLELGADSSTEQWVGMRFNNITIPQNATVLSAYMEFEVDETHSDPTSILFQGQASDNASTFTSSTNDISSRPRTTASIPWNNIPPWTVIDAKWNTPDLSPIVQEIVDQSGWTPGNSMVMIASGTGRRTAESYNGEPLAAPKLVITYTTGDTPTPAPNPTEILTSTPTYTPTQTPTPIYTLTPLPAGSIRFAVIGDYGNGSQAEGNVAELVKGWNPDFIITTGDNNYPLGEAATIDQNIGQYYHEFIFPYLGSYGAGAATNRFFPSLGNHDWETTDAQPYIDYFTLPGNERYYDFVWGPVHFFAIDSDGREPHGNLSSSAQGLWLQSQLSSSTSPWKLVYMHHPPYSSGSSHGSQPNLQWPYQAWGADVVLAGHDHTYERIVLNGFAYFVNGLGGSSVYTFTSPVPGSEVRYNGNYGAMLVEASVSHITFQFITRTGAVIDTYTLDTISTATPTSTETAAATSTLPPTPTTTATQTGTPNPISTSTSTNTPVPTATSTFSPTNSPLPTVTFTPTYTSLPTITPTNTPTNTPVPTITSTNTPTYTPLPTATFISTATETSTSTNTPLPTDTPTNTPVTPAPTFTATRTNTPTKTPVPPTATFISTDTPQATATLPASPTSTQPPLEGDVIYLSSTSGGSAGSILFGDEDILRYETATGTWSLYFDGSDVGLGASSGTDVAAFRLVDDGSILFSFVSPATIPGVGNVDDSDIVRFIPTSLGVNTAGNFDWYFDGSDVGLTTNAEDIDAVGFAPDGRLLISTRGSFSVTGASGNDEDLIAFLPAFLGSNTGGSWSLYFDGSDVGLGNSSEDIIGASIDPNTGEIYLTTQGNFSVNGVSGTGGDIFICSPVSLGSNTACTFSSYWVAAENGFGGEVVDSIGIEK